MAETQTEHYQRLSKIAAEAFPDETDNHVALGKFFGTPEGTRERLALGKLSPPAPHSEGLRKMADETPGGEIVAKVAEMASDIRRENPAFRELPEATLRAKIWGDNPELKSAYDRARAAARETLSGRA